MAARAALAGVALLAVAGMWRAAPDSLGLASQPTALSAPAAPSPRPIAIEAAAIAASVSADQPAVLNPASAGVSAADNIILAASDLRGAQ